jgi:microcystin-dependent protein
MSTYWLGDIQVFAFAFPPSGWAKCDGQLLLIAQNPDLFALLGTTFGGDGRANFALPDLRGRTAIGQGQAPGMASRRVGDQVGEESHALTVAEVGTHSHRLSGEPSKGTVSTPSENVIIAKGVLKNEAGAESDLPIYIAPMAKQVPNVKMHPDSIQPSDGGSDPHNNLMPYVTLNTCISLTGPIPPRS